MDKLEELRAEISKLDQDIVALIQERMEIAKKIGDYKKIKGLGHRDKTREKKILDEIEKIAKPAYRDTLKAIYQVMFDWSVEIQKKSYKFGLLGEKLGHSWSPFIHEKLGSSPYDLINVQGSDLDDFFEKRNFLGINVTIPYKEKVIAYIDELSPLAKKIGAVNTIVNKKGKLYGYNTDYYGFAYSLKEIEFDPKGKNVLILGHGGAAKMVKTYMEDMGAFKVKLVSIRGQLDLQGIEDAHIIVNATPRGMYPNNYEETISLDCFNNLEAVLDLIYNPLKTSLILQAKSRGLKAGNGLSMLIAQAFQASSLFQNKELAPELIGEIKRVILKKLRNIVLIGMPGSGKSTLAKKLAEILNRPLVDLDEEVVKEYGTNIPSIFKDKGEGFFRSLESDILKRVLKENSQVIASGGGSILREENQSVIRQNALVIYLQRPLDDLELSGRPLSKDIESIYKLYAERKEIYEGLSDIKVLVDRDVDISLERLLEAIEDYEDSGN